MNTEDELALAATDSPTVVLTHLERIIFVLNHNNIPTNDLAYVVTQARWDRLVAYFNKDLLIQQPGAKINANIMVIHYKGVSIFNPNPPRSSPEPYLDMKVN